MSLTGIEFVGGPADGRLYDMPAEPTLGQIIVVHVVDLRTLETVSHDYDVAVSPHDYGVVWHATYVGVRSMGPAFSEN